MGGVISSTTELVWEHFSLLVGIITACTIAFWTFVLWRSQITPKRRGICITYGNGIEVRWFTKLINYVGTKYMVFFGRYIVYFDNKSWERVLDIPGEVELLKGTSSCSFTRSHTLLPAFSPAHAHCCLCTAAHH